MFPQKEMRKAVVNTLYPFGVLEYALIAFCTYKKGVEMSPFYLAMFLSHVNKYIDAPGILVCGAQKGLPDV